MNEFKLLKQLISIPSETGEENKVCNFVLSLLKEKGFVVKKIPVEKGRFNIIAKEGNPKIYLQAHLDTVSPFIKFSEDEQYIYGRGACDTKGSAAAMISAALELKNAGKTNFGLIFTVGEEVDFAGVKKLEKKNLPFVIVGEPTSLKIVNANFGILVFKITAKGKAAHSSKPEEGTNALEILIEAIQQINKIKIFKDTIITLAKVEGGIADNIIPDKAYALYSMRISPDDRHDYPELIKSVLPEKTRFEEILNISSVKNAIPRELQFLSKAEIAKYSTELAFFKKGVIVGPGDIKFAHCENEKIEKKEFIKAVKTYSKIIKKFTV